MAEQIQAGTPVANLALEAGLGKLSKDASPLKESLSGLFRQAARGFWSHTEEQQSVDTKPFEGLL